MSYEIVKSIKIDEKQQKVFINCASNNVRPLYYSNEEYPYFSKILQTKGKEECEIEILKSFESGNLQTSLNLKYARALKVLYYLYGEEYKKFSWRLNSSEQRKAVEDSQDFKDLLFKALNTPLPREKFIIKKMSYNDEVFAHKETSRHLFYTCDKTNAKRYDFKAEAENTAKRFGLSHFEILEDTKEKESEVFKNE
jgi:hypothetical protein